MRKNIQDNRLSYEQVEKLYDNISNKVCDYTGVSLSMIRSTSRLHSIVLVRQVLIHLLYTTYQNHYYIARYINRHRTLVYHSLNAVKDYWNYNPSYREYLDNIKSCIR